MAMESDKAPPKSWNRNVAGERNENSREKRGREGESLCSRLVCTKRRAYGNGAAVKEWKEQGGEALTTQYTDLI